MRHYLLLAILVFAFFSCNEYRNDKIIPKETMIDILVDLHITDATIQVYNLSHPFTPVKQSQYDSLFAEYDTTDSLFHWNMAFYIYKKELDDMMSEVILRLNKIEGSEIRKGQKAEREKQDTLPHRRGKHPK